MPNMIPRVHVKLVRDGKRVSPPIGEPFDFTDEEIADLEASGVSALRRPINENRAEVTSYPVHPTAGVAPANEMLNERRVEVEEEPADARSVRGKPRKPASPSEDDNL